MLLPNELPKGAKCIKGTDGSTAFIWTYWRPIVVSLATGCLVEDEPTPSDSPTPHTQRQYRTY